ncbi:hypothetical protein CRYUN_Cryun05aG0236400 [Craigia yunnanensis]
MISDLLFERSVRIGNRRGSYARFSKLKDLCTSLDNWLVVGLPFHLKKRSVMISHQCKFPKVVGLEHDLGSPASIHVPEKENALESAEAKVGGNKPELLPKEFTPVIDVAGFLSDGQEKRLAQEISDVEKDTGFKMRILAQNYPDTQGNILNFNVEASVDNIQRSFWSRLQGKYGNMFYWKEKGEDASIEAAVMEISNCLREPVGPNNCSEVK